MTVSDTLAKMIGIALKISITCPDCRNPIPMGGFVVGTVECPSCHAKVALRGRLAWWEHRDVLMVCIEQPMTWAEGESNDHDDDGVQILYERAAASCAGCNRPFTVEEMVTGSAAGGMVCACATKTRMRPADPALKALLPFALFLIGEQDQASAPPPAAAPKPVMFSCPNCAAPFRVDGSNRMVQCQFCHVSSWLPDPLWAFFKPAPRVSRYFLVVRDDQEVLDGLSIKQVTKLFR
jgi:hypothetical protein